MIQPYFHSLITGASRAFIFVAALAVSSHAATFSTGQDWKITGPFGGTATAVAIDPKNPKVLLAGARNSLLFQSEDAGASWSLLNLPRIRFGEVTSILIDPSDSEHYLLGMIGSEHAGLMESHDGGKSWTGVKDVQDVGVRALAIAPSDPNRFVAGTLRGVMMTTDGGKSWTRISDPESLEMQGITAVAFDPKDPNIIYAGTTHLPWKTKDAGKNWESIHTGMIDDSDVFSIYVDPATPTNIFASACSGVYASGNQGDQWRKLLGIPNTHRRTHVIREDPTQPDVIYAGTTLGLFKSANRGTSWKVSNSDQVNALTFDPAQPRTMYLALEYKGVGKSGDSGETIRPAVDGFVNRRISAVAESGSRFVAIDTQVGDTTGIFASSDQGASWQLVPNIKGLEGVHLTVITGPPSSANNDNFLLAASPRQLYKSSDAGSTWKPLPLKLVTVEMPKTPSRVVVKRNSKGKIIGKSTVISKPVTTVKTVTVEQFNGLYSTKVGTKNVYFAATDLGLLKSEDDGERWSQVELLGNPAVTGLYFSPAFDGRMVLRTSATLYISKDFGEHWDQLTLPVSGAEVNQVAISPASQNSLLVATRGGLFSSLDNGAQWHLVSNGISASTVNSVIYDRTDPSKAYAVEYGQLFTSQDAGSTWTALPATSSSLHIRELWIPANSSSHLYAVTNDLGILFRN